MRGKVPRPIAAVFPLADRPADSERPQAAGDDSLNERLLAPTLGRSLLQREMHWSAEADVRGRGAETDRRSRSNGIRQTGSDVPRKAGAIH